jgi:tetratricopeptide (TPR) repeat protein/TolB-like protein
VAEQIEHLQAALADRYAIQRELGRGGMATVYLAHDQKLGRPVALKVLKPELAAALGPERFLREIEIAAKLTHPNILGLYDCGTASAAESTADGQRLTADFLYYTMPFVEGESLRGRLEREKQLPLDDALQITREVADALGYAHSLGLVHRDVKPENILFQAGHALVADFGIAKAIAAAGSERLTETGLAIGTPAYMSPEQAAGNPDLDGRSDLYSLGCVLYEMLSGETPYTGPTPQAILAKKLSEPLPRISVVRRTVSPGLEAALHKVLASTTADRYRTAAEFAAALAHPEALARPVTAAQRVWWRSRSAIVAGAAAVLALGIGTAVFMSGRGSGPALDPKAVAVAPFESQIRDTSLAQLGAVAADWVVQVLQGTGEIKVAPMAQVAATGWAPGHRVQELGAATGAGMVVTGRAWLEGDSIYLRADVMNARSGALLHAVPAVAGGVGQPLEAVRTLAQRLGGAVGEIVFSPSSPQPEAATIRPPASFEAYREYAEGGRLFDLNDFQGAVRHYEHAYALDTTFVRALVPLGLARSWLSVNQASAAESVWQVVERRRDELPRVDQLRFETARGNLVTGEYQKAAEASRELAQLEPPGGSALFNWGLSALMGNRPAEAVHAFVEVNPDYPKVAHWEHWPPAWWILAWAYHMLGRHQEELKTVRQGRELFPGRMFLLEGELRALASLGREDEVFRLLDEARGMEADPFIALEVGGGSPSRQPYEAAMEFRAHGHPEGYRRAIAQAVSLLGGACASDTASVATRWQCAVVLYGSEQWERAQDLYAGLHAADSLNLDFLGGLGTAQARLGHRPEAEAAAERLASLSQAHAPRQVQDWQPRIAAYWQARIAAVLGDRDRAVALLRDAMARGISCSYHFGPGTEVCHREIDFESLVGYAPFDELIRPKG